MVELNQGYRKLRTGELSLLYRDGEIRQVNVGRTCILAGIYSAVRDRNWGTAGFRVESEQVEEFEQGFRITLILQVEQEEIRYTSVIEISGEDNRLRFAFRGIAGSTFRKNRIGICILHPIEECRGKPVTIVHPDRSISRGRFPEQISPHQPFLNISAIGWEPGEGISAMLELEGEVFEMEDQRNWTDASYKTYCTPLEIPFPVEVEEGSEITQSVTLEVTAPNSQTILEKGREQAVCLLPGTFSELPDVGVGRSREAVPLSHGEAAELRKIPFSHFGADLNFASGDWKNTYSEILQEQRMLGWPLELTLRFSESFETELAGFLAGYATQPLDLKRVILLEESRLTTSRVAQFVIPRLKEAIDNLEIGGGTDAYFTELNRTPPDPELLDFCTYSICPQVHAFDNLTLLENLAGQSETVISAGKLLDLPVVINSVSLRQRVNVVATDPAGSGKPPEGDPRQHQPFAAGWTLGSLSALIRAGVTSVTYYETAGPRGILNRESAGDAGSPLFEFFAGLPGKNATRVMSLVSTYPERISGLLVERKDGLELLLANHTEYTVACDCRKLNSVQKIPAHIQFLNIPPHSTHKIEWKRQNRVR